jgi:uncharacterized protein with beta-barrel porin domain
VSGFDAGLGVVEFGACRRFSAAQVSLALGGARSSQDLPYGGNVRQTGGYVLGEATGSAFRPDLWFTLTGYYGWGEAQIDRNYQNAGLPDASRANPNVPTWAVRARIDWQDALRLVGAGFTPYLDLSYLWARVNGYTETGGGFPAQLDGRSESATLLRYGVNAIRPVGYGVRLLGTLEGVHQFNGEGSGITGQVLGLFNFALPGAQYKQNWLRAGIGADAKLGWGIASLMFNATTEGQDPTYWVSATYRVVF